MSIDPRNDRICYYEGILRAFVDVYGFCNIRGAAEKIVELEEKAAKITEKPHNIVKEMSLIGSSAAARLAGEMAEQPDDSSEKLGCAKAQEAAWNDDCDFVCDVLPDKEKAWRRGFVKAWEYYHDGDMKRELSLWHTLEILPHGAYGMDISKPLVFRTAEQTSKKVHLRLGYYNCSDDIFYEAGEDRAWRNNEVTHWTPLPEIPAINGIEGGK